MKPTFETIGTHLVDEVLSLKYDPHSAAERGYYVQLRILRADTPARHFAKGTTHHSGYSSCERCVAYGVLYQPPAVQTAASRTATRGPRPKKAAGPKWRTVVFPRKEAPRKMRDWEKYRPPISARRKVVTKRKLPNARGGASSSIRGGLPEQGRRVQVCVFQLLHSFAWKE